MAIVGFDHAILPEDQPAGAHIREGHFQQFAAALKRDLQIHLILDGRQHSGPHHLPPGMTDRISKHVIDSQLLSSRWKSSHNGWCSQANTHNAPANPPAQTVSHAYARLLPT